MDRFNIGETVICWRNSKDSNGNYADPETSMEVKIDGPGVNNIKVDYTEMTKDETGKYHYDCQTIGYSSGKHGAYYKATDGTRITIEVETFELE